MPVRFDTVQRGKNQTLDPGEALDDLVTSPPRLPALRDGLQDLDQTLLAVSDEDPVGEVKERQGV